ncbi:MAG: NAD(P)/FAD-dependent oxidoreductase [SAR202 cluster bacterium]|uniref:Amine oxidase domain-containing protein n=1 Tax=hydrothermal vent metagenome TaxID=652676 RepID=A0A160VAN7_9ZZZZ|nr:NAD(P)/FAD-dependent oxidoreductase [Dehalococcoidia bacterium]MQG14087.1 NAD(P)/FAD-dependent oxidoreductase [SAR202 cluster bacterium]MQG61739.1 NAD(P)/FAD-dependent oxidoreductase [SAR202 cluster bacterium]MQG64246.1 NAD(P)/FAD-dependent oxidoreductase [SAR202 cluster bacterium]MQG72614.1 NAD(P)/FAD-dependent oxidoreductase [SAR202 cluster bacterium]|tara:strand:- start:2228 stop:3550 length:1323 start_codon:yes stop_codon:yes gene_type:complete
MRVGIIGGGVAGLAAAYELTKQSHFAEVFEQADFLGGQASTFDVFGGRLERGYHHLFVSDTEITELIHELGLGDELAWLESSVGFYHGGKVWDFASPRDLLFFKPLPFLDRVRVGLWTLLLQKTKSYAKFEDVTAKDWLSRRMGPKGYEVIWEPLLRGKFGEFYDKIGMTWIWNKVTLRVASRKGAGQVEHLGYPMGSFGEVIEVLADRIAQQGGAVHTSASVAKIVESEGSATTLDVRLKDSESGLREYDAVIATTPSYVFTRLAPPMPEDYHNKLVGIDYLSAVLMVLVMDRPFTNKYWMNIADPDMPFVALIEHTNLIDRELYGGKHILYISNYPSRDSDLYQKSGEELMDLFVPHLQKINPDFDRSWVIEYHHHRVDGAQPIVGINYGAGIPGHRTPHKGLYLANTTQIYPEDRGTNYSVRMGRRVAQMVMDDASF